MDDVRRAHAIYGPASAILKGKMARKNPKHVDFKQRISIQAEILKHYTELPLHMYFFFINGHPYFITINGKVNYRKIIWCRGRGRKEILKRLQAIFARHTKMGFQVNEYHAENELKKIEEYLVPSTMHTQVAGDHEPTSEQNIRKLKDMTRSTVHSVPYRKIPLLMIDSIVGQEQYMLNDFPSKTGILSTMLARNIIEGRPNFEYNTIYLKLGTYIQLSEGTKNKQCIRLVGAVFKTHQMKKGDIISCT